MLIFTAGHSPIYGRQILHFIDPIFLARAKMPTAPADSLYFRRENFDITSRADASQAAAKPEMSSQESIETAYLRYLDDLPQDIQEAA